MKIVRIIIKRNECSTITESNGRCEKCILSFRSGLLGRKAMCKRGARRI